MTFINSHVYSIRSTFTFLNHENEFVLQYKVNIIAFNVAFNPMIMSLKQIIAQLIQIRSARKRA